MAGMMISTNMIFTEHSRLEYNKIFSINETKFGRGHALPTARPLSADKVAANMRRPRPGLCFGGRKNVQDRHRRGRILAAMTAKIVPGLIKFSTKRINGSYVNLFGIMFQ
ncbi:hypothetical protein BBC27_10910 [Acidithiobacillus ferrivorans]|uniref:Uncharacterized protein n=1 Tax=Acidithiobacillus ferrivorans TaxID=160808 RepID=A0A1B9BYU0_9PROT|nr:hypothetical protein BBC27_10910 [Acidithiobacillus ferrivorans]